MIKKQSLSVFLLLVLLGSAFGGKEWKIIDAMPVPVAGGKTIVYEGKIFIFGGFSDSLRSAVDLIQAFDPAAPQGQRWFVAGRMQEARGNCVLGLFDDRVYIFGGRSGFVGQDKVASAEVFSFADGISRPLEAPSVLNRIGAAGLVWNGLLVIIGGYVHPTADAPPYLMIYDPAGNRVVRQFDPFPHVLHYDQVLASAAGRLYVFGGIRQGISNRIFELDPATWQIRRLHPDLKRPLAGCAAVKTMNDSIYIIGGYNEKQKAARSVVKFLVSPHGFELQEDEEALNVARRELTAAYLDSVLYVFGGQNAYQMVSEVEMLSFKKEGGTRVAEKLQAVAGFVLEQNYPNPFNASTTLAFSLDRSETVRLDIFSADGRLVRTFEQFYNPGRHTVHWNGTDETGMAVAGGVYFYRLTLGDQSLTRKMLLVK